MSNLIFTNYRSHSHGKDKKNDGRKHRIEKSQHVKNEQKVLIHLKCCHFIRAVNEAIWSTYCRQYCNYIQHTKKT